MSKSVEFFYDYVSPYSYLANSQLGSLDADIDYRPMLLGAVMNSIGNKPPALLKPRGRYLFTDVQRWANHYQLPYKMHPDFPLNTVKALRVVLLAQETDAFPAVHEALFAAAWERQLDVNDDAVLARIIEDAGLDASVLLAHTNEDETKQRLRNNTEEAITRGVFGAPTFFVDGEMFFGNDRLHFVKDALNENRSG